MAHTQGDTPDEDHNPELTRFAQKFTAQLTAFFDVILGPFLNPQKSGDTADTMPDEQPQDWDPDMPYRPDSHGVHTVLTGVILVLRDSDATTRRMTVTAFPTAGSVHGQPVKQGDSIKLPIQLPTDLPQNTVDAYLQRIEMWAMTETPLVLCDRDDDPLLLVNDQFPDEWLPVEL